MAVTSRILLCGINSQYIHSNPAIWSLRTAAEQYACQYHIVLPNIAISEYTINDAYEHILGEILRQEPEILGFSVYIWNVKIVRALLQDLRKVLPHCRIVLGGPEVSFGCTHIPTNLYDCILSGEGERKFFAQLVRWLNLEMPLDFDENCLLSGGEIPFIYTEDNMKFFRNRIVYYESSRGCPYSCAYCLSGKEDAVRFKPLSRVFQELDFFMQQRVPQVKFVDRTFNCNPQRAHRILTYLLENAPESGMNFHFECAGDLFDEAQLAVIQKAPAGLFQFEIGIQSTCEKALSAACRKTDIEKVFCNVGRLMAMGNVNVHVDLIAGLPGEDYYRFQHSFNQVYALGAHQLQLGFLKLLRGAPLNQMIQQYGYIFSDNPPYEILENSLLSFREILGMKGVEDVLNRYYNSGRYSKTLAYLTARVGSPWEFYEGLSQWFLHRGLLGRGLSARNASEELLAYAQSILPEEGERISWLLLEDFYSSDPSDVVPISLKPLHVSPKAVRTMLPDCPSGFSVREVAGKRFFVNYTERDPVTGRFCLIPGE